MELDQLRSALAVAPAGERRLASVAANELPGYAVHVHLALPATVRVDYQVGWLDEGEASFRSAYPSLEEAVAAIGAWLGRPFANWDGIPFIDEAITRPERAALDAAHQALQRRVEHGAVSLPSHAHFVLIDGFWSRFDSHGHYAPLT